MSNGDRHESRHCPPLPGPARSAGRLIAECGEALYGLRWHTPLAADLRCSRRTLQRWVSGTEVAPAGVFAILERVTRERAATLRALMTRSTHFS